MKKVIFDQTGEPADVLKIVDVPMPEPKAGQVRVKVMAAPVNPSDLLYVQGKYGLAPRLPEAGVGFEGAGIIDAIGTGVGGGIELSKGARVCFTANGSWAEYVTVPISGLMPLPDKTSFEIGAQMYINPVTALVMLKEAALKEGEWLLLTGGASSVNRVVIQLANRRGIRTICTVRSSLQEDVLKELGATEVVNIKQDKLKDAVMTITGGKGADCCFEAVGGSTGLEALLSLAQGGKCIVYGMMSGEPIPIDSGALIFNNIQVNGFWLSNWFKKANLVDMLKTTRELYSLISNEEIAFGPAEKYFLHDVQKAVQHNSKMNRLGKVVLVNK
jgi:NADPH:quinone reductase-like Zn-dependent oxidoreductase